MSLTVFTAAPLTAPNTSATVGITDANVVAGIGGGSGLPVGGVNPDNTNNGAMPIWGGPCDGTRRGVFLTASLGARLTFRLIRGLSGTQGQPGTEQVLFSGDQSAADINNRPILSVTSTSYLTAQLVTCAAGTLTLSVVQ